MQKWRTLWIQRTRARSPLEVKHGPKSLINIISTFEMKMTLSEVFDVVLKDLQEVLVQGQVLAKDEGPWRDIPPVKNFLHCQIFKYGFKMGHFILLYIVETQKFHLEHCKIKADFTLNVLLVRISVL